MFISTRSAVRESSSRSLLFNSHPVIIMPRVWKLPRQSTEKLQEIAPYRMLLIQRAKILVLSDTLDLPCSRIHLGFKLSVISLAYDVTTVKHCLVSSPRSLVPNSRWDCQKKIFCKYMDCDLVGILPCDSNWQEWYRTLCSCRCLTHWHVLYM